MAILLFLIVVLTSPLLLFGRGDKKKIGRRLVLSLRYREGLARKYCKGYGLLREN
jgi:hypothetical protein